MGSYNCPRCHGTEIYFAKRQRMTGFGGIYGTRSKMVNTPLCKTCGENAEYDGDETTYVFKMIGKISIIVIAFLFIYVVASSVFYG